jgi:hypothetical protein
MPRLRTAVAVPLLALHFFIVQQPVVGQGLLINKASLSHSDTPPSVGLLWTSDQPDAETSDNTQHSEETDIHAPGGI